MPYSPEELNGASPQKLRTQALNLRDELGLTSHDAPLPASADSLVKWILEHQSGVPPKSLWIRMGEEAVIRPMCNDLYDRHASDPITASWFPPSSTWNQRTAEQVKENVFTFFSSGIGGPHEYKGNDMVAAHAKMAEQKPITEAAFHALTYHVLEQMTKHRSGGAQEMEEVWAILMSLKPQVTSGGMRKFEPASESLYDRMGGEAVLRPMCNELYEFHASDPITAPWFPPSSTWNQRTADQVKENVFTFFSSGIGGPHKYEGQDMVAAHAKMREMKPITEAAFHALVFHVMAMMKKHNSGGEQEMDEVWGILMSLKSQVMEGK
jgi:truncated hemoglobin YjbI